MSSSPEQALPDLLPPTHNSGLLEVFRRRYLLRLLVRSTIQARYQGTVLGWTWSYLQPLVRFGMFYFLFQVMIERGAGMENFAVHLFAGMVLVHLFTETFNGGTKSLVSNRSLIVKLAMPDVTPRQRSQRGQDPTRDAPAGAQVSPRTSGAGLRVPPRNTVTGSRTPP